MNCIYANTIYTGRSVVNNSYILFEGRKVAGITKSKQGDLLGKFAVLTPAFIDPHSHIGMYRAGEPMDRRNANETAAGQNCPPSHPASYLARPVAFD